MVMRPNHKQQEAQCGMLKSYLSQGVVILVASLALCGCNTVDRTQTSTIPMDDYRVRHPITLAETSRTIDVFPSGASGHLDMQSAERISEFGRLYQQFGQGPIVVLYPTGPGVPNRVSPESIRQALAAGGAHTGVRIGSYPVTNPQLASPVRLSFTGLKAKVATPCGEWPSDLASGSTIQGWDNKPYWNLGCSYQSAFAAQVADPRDLVSPQAETPMDTVMRARGIDTIRKGTDPSTPWQAKPTSISSVGGN
jgi:pilus assembly protein CpaD